MVATRVASACDCEPDKLEKEGSASVGRKACANDIDPRNSITKTKSLRENLM